MDDENTDSDLTNLTWLLSSNVMPQVATATDTSVAANAGGCLPAPPFLENPNVKSSATSSHSTPEKRIKTAEKPKSKGTIRKSSNLTSSSNKKKLLVIISNQCSSKRA